MDTEREAVAAQVFRMWQIAKAESVCICGHSPFVHALVHGEDGYSHVCQECCSACTVA